MDNNLLDTPAWPELKKLNARIKTLLSNTEAACLVSGWRDDPWEATYDMIFSDVVRGRVSQALDDLNLSMEYYDPDTSCEADVRAYAGAVAEKVEMLQIILENGEPLEP